MRRKKEDDDDIKVVLMTPEYFPRAQEKFFDFFYEKFMREHQSNKDNKFEDAK